MGSPDDSRPVRQLPLRIQDETTTIEVHALADCPADLQLLPESDKGRYRSFKNPAAADSFVRRQSELRRRLADYADMPEGGVTIGAEVDGKPFLRDRNGQPSSLHFNMSSSAGLMALAVDFTRPIGVDIECHSLHGDLSASSLAPALHPAELDRLAADNLDDILQCWVYKEAWIKWTGEGMRADLKGLELWHPGLTERFVNRGNLVRLSRINTTTDSAWVGLVKAAGEQ